MISRETIYSKLFTLVLGLKGTHGIQTVSRKLKHFADVPPAQQPAIFQVQRFEDPVQTRLLPTKWKLNVDLYVYVNTAKNPNASPAVLLNPILDAIEALFPPEEGNIQTLGGLCSHAWISGKIETTEGLLGDQEVAVVPIEILAPV